MKTTIQITDDLYDSFSRQAEEMQQAGQSVSAEEIMTDRLSRFKDVSPSDRVVVIDPKTRGRLETLLSGGSLKDASDLLTKVESLVNVKIGDIRVDFSPAEAAQIQRWAVRNGRTPEFIIRDVVGQIKLHLFDRIPT